MTEEFKRGLSYNSTCFSLICFGSLSPMWYYKSQHSLYIFKGVYNLRPPTPKCFAIWNVNTLLSHVQHKVISSFYDITKKIAILFMILAGARVNTLVHHLKVMNIYLTDTEVILTFGEVLKHSWPSYKQKPPIFRAFTSRDLCPVTTLITYTQTACIRWSSFIYHNSKTT